MKILVTGGAGFIGRHLVDRLVNLNHQVFIVDNLSVSSNKSLNKKVQFIKHDICDPSISKLFRKISPQVVFHLAADNRVTSSPKQTINSNVIGTFNILLASQKAKIKHFIFTSSAAVYGESKNLPIKEIAPTKPISSYGVSKLTGEMYCQLFKSDFKSTIFRFANVYGPGQNSTSEGGVVAIFINKFLQDKKPIIYGTGQQTRDFVFVGDVVDALVLALNQRQSIILNIGSSKEIKIIDLLKLTAQLINTKPQYIKKSKRSVEIEKSLFDSSRASAILKWNPKTSLAEGLELTINYFKKL